MTDVLVILLILVPVAIAKAGVALIAARMHRMHAQTWHQQLR